MKDDDGLGWQDIALIGSLSEEIAEEEKARRRLEQEVEPEEEDEEPEA